jgi:uncharacterized protein YjdB
MFPLSAIVAPQGAYAALFTWSSTDDDSIMILSYGRIIAVSAETATITIKANNGGGSYQKHINSPYG